MRALLARQIDVAVVWGPEAGYFDKLHGHLLQLTPVEPEVDVPALPMTFMISMGVRQRDTALRDRLNQFLERNRSKIELLLRSYGVPLLPVEGGIGAAAGD
jgi:mxaJ protein